MTSKWLTRIMASIALLSWSLSESAAQGSFPPGNIEGSPASGFGPYSVESGGAQAPGAPLFGFQWLERYANERIGQAREFIANGNYQGAEIANAQAGGARALIAARLRAEEGLAPAYSPLQFAFYWAGLANLEAGEAAMTARNDNGLAQALGAAERAHNASILAQQWAYRAQWDEWARQWDQAQQAPQWDQWVGVAHGFQGLGSR